MSFIESRHLLVPGFSCAMTDFLNDDLLVVLCVLVFISAQFLRERGCCVKELMVFVNLKACQRHADLF